MKSQERMFNEARSSLEKRRHEDRERSREERNTEINRPPYEATANDGDRVLLPEADNLTRCEDLNR